MCNTPDLSLAEFNPVLFVVEQVSSGDEYVLITPDMGIFYAAVDFICSEIGNAAEIHGEGVLPIVVDCVNMKGVDYSTAVV